MKVGTVRAWLANFADDADVETVVRTHPSQMYPTADSPVTLHVTIEGKSIGATLDLSKEEP